MNIDEINDHFEIERLMIKYVEAIDNKDWNMLDEVFTEQAFLDYESSGGPEGKGDYPTIKKWLQKNLSMFPMTQHMIGKSFIEYHGDSAKCRTMFHNPVGVPINADGVYDPEGESLHVLSLEDGTTIFVSKLKKAGVSKRKLRNRLTCKDRSLLCNNFKLVNVA